MRCIYRWLEGFAAAQSAAMAVKASAPTSSHSAGKSVASASVSRSSLATW